MLDQTELLGSLRKFCDPDHGTFEGFPTTQAQARRKWAAAFAAYFDQVQEDITPPVPGHPSLKTSGVEDAFFGDLGLEPVTSAATAATDFAGAWSQGVLAVTLGTPAVDGSSNSYAFLSWTNVTSLHDTLESTLRALFEVPASTAAARLDAIAGAFHTATSGLSASVTITSSSGVSSPGTMGVL